MSMVGIMLKIVIRFVSCFLIVWLVSIPNVYAVEFCFSEEQAKQIVVELKQKRALEQEVREYESLVENLKKQNEILKEQTQLLREQVELYKNQRQLYDIALKECEKKQSIGLIEKGKWFVYGSVSGLIFLMFLIK
jgi:predicted tellurium resistance membrane protein TerC